jgi:hypothetical protein
MENFVGNNKLEIPMKKVFFVFSMIGSIAFVISGIYIIVSSFSGLPEISENNFFSNPFVMVFIGILPIIFFGFGLILLFRKFIDKNPGLIIDSIGIIDNTTAFSTKRIKWENIKQIKKYNLLFGLFGQFIVIVVDNNDIYIKQHKNKIFQIMARLDHRMTGSPINIPSNVLKCKQNELVNILQNELIKRNLTNKQ